MNDNPVLRELQSVKVILKGKDSEGERGCLPWISKAKGVWHLGISECMGGGG